MVGMKIFILHIMKLYGPRLYIENYTLCFLYQCYHNETRQSNQSLFSKIDYLIFTVIRRMKRNLMQPETHERKSFLQTVNPHAEIVGKSFSLSIHCFLINTMAESDFESAKSACLDLCAKVLDEVKSDLLQVDIKTITQEREFSTKSTVCNVFVC